MTMQARVVALGAILFLAAADSARAQWTLVWSDEFN